MRNENTEKKVVVTGGSRGIGKAIVSRLKKGGYQVAACATKLSNLKDSEADLKFECDVTNLDQVKRFAEIVRSQWGTIHALVNNAGVAGSNTLAAEETDELWHRIIDTNLNGTYYVTKAFLPLFSNEGGSIVNFSSVLGLKGVPDSTAYCAAKHAVIGFTRSLALSLASKKITVNAICPGWTRTDMALDRISEMGLEVEKIAKGIPIGRIIEPQEIAEFTYFAISKSANGMTGQTLTVDGGFLA